MTVRRCGTSDKADVFAFSSRQRAREINRSSSVSTNPGHREGRKGSLETKVFQYGPDYSGRNQPLWRLPEVFLQSNGPFIAG